MPGDSLLFSSLWQFAVESRALGVQVDDHGHGRLTVHGVGLQGLRTPVGAIDVRNAGTLMRLLTGICAMQPSGVFTLDGDDSIRTRPMERVAAPLNQHQFDALCSFAFNCGVGVTKSSGVARAINAGAFQPMPRTAKLSMPSLIFGFAAAAKRCGVTAEMAEAAARPWTKERRFMVGASQATPGGSRNPAESWGADLFFAPRRA